MIFALIDEAIQAGARLGPAAEIMGLSARTIIRWRKKAGGEDGRKGPKTAPNKLSEKERQKVLDAANSPEFRDLSPKQIVPKLADKGGYLASESTFYRVLRAHAMLAHHQSSKPAVSRRPEEHVATGPWQVWSWDSVPQRHRTSRQYVLVSELQAQEEMVVGPPKSAVGSRLQTSPSCGCQEHSW